jgi:C1A family cysteine protease
VAWIRDQLRQNCPVVIGLHAPEPTYYPDKFPDKKNEWQDPENPKPSSNGHCIVALGYDDTRLALKIQDSHGSRRFDLGCWWMGYRVADSQVVREVYSLVP